MKPPIIQCQECHGTGQTPLSERLMETFSALGSKECTSEDLRIDGMTRNAINNRLEELREIGLVRRRRQGKFWLYAATPKNSTPKKSK